MLESILEFFSAIFRKGAYEAFPKNDAPFVSGTTDDFPWSLSSGARTVTSKDQTTEIDVTSGAIEFDAFNNGKITDYNFRMLLFAYSKKRKVKWTNTRFRYSAVVESLLDDAPRWAGLHIFLRYRTSYDLYVFSIRMDGLVTIKRKWLGLYTTLESITLPEKDRIRIGEKITIEAHSIANNLSLLINGTLVLSTQSGTFSWGTAGIRTDYVKAVISDLSIS